QRILRAHRQFLRRLVRVSKIDFVPVEDGCAGDKLVRQRHRIAPPQGLETGLVRPANSGKFDQIVVGKRNGHDRFREQVQPAAHDGVEDRLRVGRRVADNFENFRGRGLLLQRFRKIISALAQFVQQARVLDGDDGLGCEILNQLDLFVGEGTDFLTIDAYGSHQCFTLKHRYAQKRSGPTRCYEGNHSQVAFNIGRLSGEVADVNDFTRGSNSGERTSRIHAKLKFGTLSQPNGIRKRTAFECNHTKSLTFAEKHMAELGFANMDGVLQHSLENRG